MKYQEGDAHHKKLVAMLAELKHQHQNTGTFNPSAAAAAVGHGAIADILWADAWLQSELGKHVEHLRQTAVNRRRALSRAIGGGADQDQRSELVRFSLDLMYDPNPLLQPGDRLRAASLAAELLGLRKHLPQPVESGQDQETERRAATVKELYEEYPELAAGHAAESAEVPSNGKPTNGKNGV